MKRKGLKKVLWKLTFQKTEWSRNWQILRNKHSSKTESEKNQKSGETDHMWKN